MDSSSAMWLRQRPRLWRDFYLPAFRHILQKFSQWRAARRSRRELDALDDRTLKDIGLAQQDPTDPLRDTRSLTRPCSLRATGL